MLMDDAGMFCGTEAKASPKPKGQDFGAVEHFGIASRHDNVEPCDP
jgi:hypothetical protein